jgi:hypothetical protein
MSSQDARRRSLPALSQLLGERVRPPGIAGTTRQGSSSSVHSKPLACIESRSDSTPVYDLHLLVSAGPVWVRGIAYLDRRTLVRRMESQEEPRGAAVKF